MCTHDESETKNCEPIIEEPITPEPEYTECSQNTVEDVFDNKSNYEIPTIKINLQEFTENVKNYIKQCNIEVQEDMSKALVALSPGQASNPIPKLKNINGLRTEHQVGIKENLMIQVGISLLYGRLLKPMNPFNNNINPAVHKNLEIFVEKKRV